MGTLWGHHGDNQGTVRGQKEHGGETVGTLQTLLGRVRRHHGNSRGHCGDTMEHCGVTMGTHWGNWGDQGDTLDTLLGHL